MFEICGVCQQPYDSNSRIKANFIGRTKMCYECYNKQSKVIAMDFDATLTNYSGWKGSEHKGEPLEGSKEFLKELKEMGYRIFIVTSRPLKGIEEWLKLHGMDIYIDKITNLKVAAHCYIDDRAINFSGNYNETLKTIKEFIPYYKNKK